MLTHARSAGIQRRVGSQKVQKLLDQSEAGKPEFAIDMLNLGEVYYRLAKTRGENQGKVNYLEFAWLPCFSFFTFVLCEGGEDSDLRFLVSGRDAVKRGYGGGIS